MATFGVICLIVLVGIGILIYLQKTEKVGDRDKDLIPDVVEDTIEEKKRVKAVKKEAKEEKVAISKAAKEVKDVAKAAAGKKTTKKRGRKPSKK